MPEPLLGGSDTAPTKITDDMIDRALTVLGDELSGVGMPYGVRIRDYCEDEKFSQDHPRWEEYKRAQGDAEQANRDFARRVLEAALADGEG